MRSRFCIGLATVLLLVLLRLLIGWHFFSEGLKHYADPSWSSETFLRAATGPLAPRFKSVPTDYPRWEQLMHGEEMNASEPKQWRDDILKWSKGVSERWEALGRRLSNHYGFSEKQKTQTDDFVKRYKAQLTDWLDENQEPLRLHVAEWRRLVGWQERPTAKDLPFEKKRVAEKQSALAAESNGWLSQIKTMERALQCQLLDLRDSAQRDREQVPSESSSLRTIDTVMKYGILGIGVCLLAGLFTRLAALLGALFLFSVVLTQPFWLAEAGPTYSQYLEMFALLTLATTRVGRWGGLDFFIHTLLVRPLRSAKGHSDAPNS